MNKPVTMALLAAPMALVACAGHDSGPNPTSLPSAPPTALTKVASGNFTSPTDTVSSPDGSEFFFAAYDSNHNPGIYSTASQAGSTA